MADESEKGGNSPKEKSGSGLIGVVILAVASLASSFAVAYFLTPSHTSETLACEGGELSTAQTQPLISPEQAYVEMQDILITIGREPASRYLKMKLAIITQEGAVSAVKEAEPVLMDAFVNYLRSLELSDFEDPGFYPRMREQLAHRSKLVLGSANSEGVLITEFLLR